MDTDGWRAALSPDARERVVDKIVDSLKKNLPFPSQEGLQGLKNIAVRFEEKIYTDATSQSDYLRKISMKMMTIENKSQNAIPNSANGTKPTDPGASHSAQPEVQNQGQSSTVQNLSMEQNCPANEDTCDWKAQLDPDARERIVNKITEMLKRHLPFSNQEGLQELNRIAGKFEEKIYAAATSQSDYLGKISLKMLTMENKSLPNE